MSVFNDDTLRIEQIVGRFEDQWSQDVDIRAYLPEEASPALREEILWELLETDLELRIKAGHTARIEQYLESFGELRESPERLAALVHSEYRLRSRREPGLSHYNFEKRFPELSSYFSFGQETRSHNDASGHVHRQAFRNGAPEFVGELTAHGSRFRLMRPHEEGGLGKVWVAFDNELNREVALKEIRQKYADDEISRRRFATEAMVTSSLEHPGIVPVYGFGQYNDGRPYYTMRFVRGVSFRTAIRNFHQTDWSTRPAGARRVEMRRLLSQFLNVCNTIHYAHQRGVLHRDLKPSNIMLGDYGETWVVDWGLAKTSLTQSIDDSQHPIVKDLQRADGATKIGRALGSPAYMSPEQARGAHNTLGPSTDVYSLGATLYTLLTNRAPVSGENTEELLSAVKESTWPRPRSVRPNASRALESVCLKAMSFNPKQRYQSAQELADDIERYLADQPTIAHKESLVERFSRFARRNDVLVRAAGLVLITVTITSMVSAIVINQQRRMADLAALSAEDARRAALRSRVEAENSRADVESLTGVLQDMFELVDDETGSDVTLTQAVERAEAKVASEPNARERATSYLALARVCVQIRLFQNAVQYSEEAVAILEARNIPGDTPRNVPAESLQNAPKDALLIRAEKQRDYARSLAKSNED